MLLELNKRSAPTVLRGAFFVLEFVCSDQSKSLKADWLQTLHRSPELVSYKKLSWSKPESVAKTLHQEPGFVWIDSADEGGSLSRYSYICFNPIAQIYQRGRQIFLDGVAIEKPVFEILKDWNSVRNVDLIADGPEFQGGAVGYLSYEFGTETVDGFSSRFGLPEQAIAEFGFYDSLISFDHHREDLFVLSSGICKIGVNPDSGLADSRVADIVSKIGKPSSTKTHVSTRQWAANNSKDEFVSMIEQAQEYIVSGEMYQANIAHCSDAQCDADLNPIVFYSALRSRNPAPYAVFGSFEDRIIASTSPESLMSVSPDGWVETRPIKGTIKSSENKEEDNQLMQSLLSSEKDRAENVMIVDLLRNDLSRVCTPDSVSVTGLCELETYEGLHHLTSTVKGKLADVYDAIDVLSVVFPGGSITGAPKLRAMEVIDEIETSRRGAFCGTLGWIGHDGASKFNILIRTVEITNGTMRFWSGAGITLLSDAASEYDETKLKSQKIIGCGRGKGLKR